MYRENLITPIFLKKILIGLVLLMVAGTAISVPDEEAEDPERVAAHYRVLETLARGLFYLETMYVDAEKVEQEAMVRNALHGVVAKLDPHTMLMPRKAFEQLTIDTQGKFGGIGIMVSSEQGHLIVVSPIEDTPAFKAGIKPGDEIMTIDGKSVNKMKNEEATELMRGPPETKISLSVKRKGVDKLLKFDLIREIIKVRSVRTEMLDKGVGYARIITFQDNTANEMEVFLKQSTKDLKGLILDLRDNPGGLLDQAVRISDLFIESGVVVSTVGRSKANVEREFAHKRGTYTGFPIIVLINGGSASASEIVAGALQDHERALVLGTTSFGKGSVQTLLSLPDGSGLKITVARYYTPKDRSIQAKGIVPDVIVAENEVKQTKAEPDKRRSAQKESDLRGHIESQDLSDIAKSSSLLKNAENWPDNLKSDYQLLTAYSYLRGWGLFQKKPF